VKAMILAAGLGERMRPLTDHTPKPLLQVQGAALIEHHLRALAQAGFTEVVVNVSHLGKQVMDYCGDGHQWGLNIQYSPEDSPLETAGGILQALPLLGDQPFLVVNGDIYTDYPFEQLRGLSVSEDCLAHLVFVGNPEQHPLGDFSLGQGGVMSALSPGEMGVTYAGIGVYSPDLLAGLLPGKTPLRPLLDGAITDRRLFGEFYTGRWVDVGTPERLEQLNSG
jgi:MurNAc alpha-1-phosphate uridylyltransferase